MQTETAIQPPQARLGTSIAYRYDVDTARLGPALMSSRMAIVCCRDSILLLFSNVISLLGLHMICIDMILGNTQSAGTL